MAGLFGLEEESSSCRLFLEEKTSVVEVTLFREGDVVLDLRDFLVSGVEEEICDSLVECFGERYWT